MKCPQCGKEIADDSKFCASCGAKIEESASPQIPKESPAPADGKKQRHWFITFWLWLMIVVNVIMSLFNMANAIGAVSYVASALMVVNVIGAIMLLNGKKVGFWIFVMMAAISCILNVALESIAGAFGAVIGVAILFGILQITKDGVPYWSQLE